MWPTIFFEKIFRIDVFTQERCVFADFQKHIRFLILILPDILWYKMSKLLKYLQNPVLIFGLLTICYAMFHTLKDDNIDFVIRSDGRGYYAYLPALFIYNDGSFEKSAAAEKGYFEHSIDQLYLFKDAKGKQYNKYFPGIAILQAPFFAAACIVSWITGYPMDGYSAVFRLFYYLGSLFYFACGLLLFAKILQRLFPDESRLKWLIPCLYFVTSLFFYCVITPSFTHLYSFFLFGLFAWLILRLKDHFNLRNVFLTGLTLGLIALVRPTNLTVMLMIPFLLGSWTETKAFFQKLFQLKKLLTGILGFVIVLSVLFLLWKWQTGSWIVWSYSGEGFTFLHPHLFATLFSFRTGLFLHAPVMFLVLFGLLLLFRKNKFQAVFWLLYFVINIWVIASWWCWDYESPFGNRPLTEHFFFLLIPLVYVVREYKKLSIICLSGLTLIGIIRFQEIKTGFMGDQRFTKQNYFSSLQFWKKQNDNRWNFTRSCVPFGKKAGEFWLLSEAGTKSITAADEFVFTVEKALPQPRTNEKFYYRVELEKQISQPSLTGVMLVIDAWNKAESKRYYKTVELFNDRLEGYGRWTEPLIFEGHIHDYLQEYDFVKIYIWNQGRQALQLRNVKIVLEEYKS